MIYISIKNIRNMNILEYMGYREIKTIKYQISFKVMESFKGRTPREFMLNSSPKHNFKGMAPKKTIPIKLHYKL